MFFFCSLCDCFQAKNLVDAVLRAEEEGERCFALFEELKQEGKLALSGNMGLVKERKILKLGGGGGGTKKKRRKAPLRLSFTYEMNSDEEEEAESSDEANLARVKLSRGPVVLAKKDGLRLMRNVVAATASTIEPKDPNKRAKAAERAQAVLKARAEAAAAAAAAATAKKAGKKAGKRKGAKKKKVQIAGHESDEEEEEDIAGVPNEFLSSAFEHWAMMREDNGGPLLRCYQSFIMSKWQRMANPSQEVGKLVFFSVRLHLPSCCCVLVQALHGHNVPSPSFFFG